jgi:hypothetical protein
MILKLFHEIEREKYFQTSSMKLSIIPILKPGEDTTTTTKMKIIEQLS